jgi:hypothetical protein
VLQTTARFRFPAKSRTGSFIFDKTRIENFYSYWPIDKQVARAINRTHTTNAQSFLEPILIVECVSYEWVNWSGGSDR